MWYSADWQLTCYSAGWQLTCYSVQWNFLCCVVDWKSFGIGWSLLCYSVNWKLILDIPRLTTPDLVRSVLFTRTPVINTIYSGRLS
jgi:hypothetical protein